MTQLLFKETFREGGGSRFMTHLFLKMQSTKKFGVGAGGRGSITASIPSEMKSTRPVDKKKLTFDF